MPGPGLGLQLVEHLGPTEPDRHWIRHDYTVVSCLGVTSQGQYQRAKRAICFRGSWRSRRRIRQQFLHERLYPMIDVIDDGSTTFDRLTGGIVELPVHEPLARVDRDTCRRSPS